MTHYRSAKGCSGEAGTDSPFNQRGCAWAEDRVWYDFEGPRLPQMVSDAEVGMPEIAKGEFARQSGVSATLEEDATLLHIVIDRPEGNVLTRSAMEHIAQVLAAHSADADLRLVLIRSAGRHFSFGVSIQEHQRDQVPAMLTTFHSLVRQVASYPVPVAALVQGYCFGGAFELVLCCHLVFATPSAVFSCPEIKLGVIAPVLAVVGPLRLGSATAERLLLTGERLDAHATLRCGLVTKVLQDGGPPEREFLLWYRKHLRPLSAFALRQATLAVRSGSTLLESLERPLDRVERQYVQEIVASHDGNEGIAAFLERRDPVWRNS